MRTLILGTAGHIDHGKTALVRVLTGVDTDRLPEEKRRGITIDLGFARLTLPDGTEIGIVDVPGHEAFVRNMLAGATGIDLALLVVAADEGVMPQTREHLAVLELLGVARVVVALTKADLVERDWLPLVEDEVRELLAHGPLATARIVPVSARTGAGLPDVLAALQAACAEVGQRAADDLFRMPIDRVFTIHGTGTVVTGTIWSGRIQRDAIVRLWPSGREARVRGVHVHGQDRAVAQAGERTALALAGIARDDVRRGTVAVLDGQWELASMITLRASVLRDAPRPLRHRQRVRVHLGTTEVLGRIVSLEDEQIPPGAQHWAQLRLENPVVARAGDRVVLRSYSPVTTIGGGTVVEPIAPKRKRLDQQTRALFESVLGTDTDSAIRQAARAPGATGTSIASLAITTAFPPDAILAAIDRAVRDGAVLRIHDRIFDARLAAQVRSAILATVERHHESQPLSTGIDREALRRAAAASGPLGAALIDTLLADRALEADGNRLRCAGFSPRFTTEQLTAAGMIAHTLATSGLTPPALTALPDGLARRADLHALLDLLEREGTLVRIAPDHYLHAEALAGAIQTIRERLAGGASATAAELRTALGLTRKHLIPLLEFLDATGITTRYDDRRQLASPRESTAARGS